MDAEKDNGLGGTVHVAQSESGLLVQCLSPGFPNVGPLLTRPQLMLSLDTESVG
jgi:hypothetical protein